MSEQEYKDRLDKLEVEVDEIREEAFKLPTYEEFEKYFYTHPKVKEYRKLWREYKLIKTYTLRPFDELDKKCVMPFEQFAEMCKVGPFFTDYDGSGYYATEDSVSNIGISPSDIVVGIYRKDFTHVCWYNK